MTSLDKLNQLLFRTNEDDKAILLHLPHKLPPLSSHWQQLRRLFAIGQGCRYHVIS